METIDEKEKLDNISFITLNNKIKIDITKLKEILPSNNNHGLCGSKNLGNTCYMNSSIACLSNCTELTTFFLSKEFKKYINSSNKNGLKGKLANEWYKLLKNYWKTEKSSGNPSDIKSLIGKKYKKFDNYEQQDANEFIIIFLELLSEDLNEIKNKKYIELKEQQPKESDEECAKRFWELHISRNNSIITDLFCGLNKSTIKCPICKYKSITYNPFTSISLLIPNKEQIKNIKYLNFPEDDIFICYIPKFSLGKTYKIKIRIEKNTSFKNILDLISKVKEFPFEIKNIDFISVINKEVFNIIKEDEIYNDIVKKKKGFYFVLERELYKDKDKNKIIFIPIYIKIGDKFSAYPRGLHVYYGMTYKLIKKKIYFIARKYIYSLLSSSSKNYKIDKKIKKLTFEYSKKEEETLIELIEKEYNDIEEKNKNKNKIIFPYNIIIKKNINSEKCNIIFDGEKDIFDNLKEYKISSDENSIDSLIKDLHNLNNIIIININNNSKYFRKSTSEFIDKCNVIESEDYCKQNYIEDNNITLDDCLQLYNKEENLEKGNEWFCKRCKNSVNALKKLEFFYLPKIMCISLTRFKKYGNDYEKNDKFVNFPLNNLNMNKYMVSKNKNNYIYDIFAVNEHYGSKDGGHYTAICKNYDGNWYSYDDSNCSQASKNEVCTKNAYILFYRRRDW